MSSDESFLARWSRRKREASRPGPERAKPDRDEGGETVRNAAQEEPAALDHERLPPIESIGAASDLRAFLKPGVPLDLTRAALRRAWSADPTIRDFIGLSENSWDFTAPDGVPGFGSLDADQVRRLLAQVTGETEVSAPAPGGSDRVPDLRDAAERSRTGRLEDSPRADREEQMPRQEKGDAAARQDGEKAGCRSSRQRRHGGALPE